MDHSNQGLFSCSPGRTDQGRCSLSSTAWGLLIGIDRYKYSRPNFPDAEFHDLRGAAADVEDMRALLEQNLGFAPERGLRIMNRRAPGRGEHARSAGTDLRIRSEEGDYAHQ